MILYTDVIHSILHFIPFTDLSTITQLNHQFRDAVRTLQPRKYSSIELTPSVCRVLQQHTTSALIPHVGHVTPSVESRVPITTQCEVMCLFTSLLAALLVVEDKDAYAANKITRLNNSLLLSLPATITTIDVCCTRHSLQSVVNCLGNLPQLTDVEIYYMGKWINPEPNLAPLLKLTKLERLAIELVDPDKSTSHVDVRLSSFFQVIRQMKQLRYLRIDSSTDMELQELVPNGNQLHQLEDFSFLDRISDYSLQLLLTLPSLKSITGELWAANIFTLPQFTHLECLYLLISDDSPLIPPVADVISSMSALHHLQQWKFSHPFVTGDDLLVLLAKQSKLERLILIQMESLCHLSAFEHGPVTQSLVEVGIQYCFNLSSSEIWKLKNLQHLEELAIVASFEGRLSECGLQLLKPSSPFRIIPTLQMFEYCHPPSFESSYYS